MRFDINAVVRLIALIAALIFFGVGIWMVINGISAEGSIDIKSALISGSLKSGSAGLFIVMLAFFLAVFALVPWSSKSHETPAPPTNRSSRIKRALHLFYLLGAAFGMLILGATTLTGPAQALCAVASVFLGMVLVGWIIFLGGLIAED